MLYPAIAKHQSKEDAERLLAETHAAQQVLADLNAVSDPADLRVAELVRKTIQVGLQALRHKVEHVHGGSSVRVALPAWRAAATVLSTALAECPWRLSSGRLPAHCR